MPIKHIKTEHLKEKARGDISNVVGEEDRAVEDRIFMNV